METAQAEPKKTKLLLALVIGVIAVAFAFGYHFGRAPAAPANDSDTPFGGAEAAQVFHGNAGSSQVASLRDLLPGLEAKVKAHPEDLDQQTLLAQTYAELGERDKALAILRPLRKKRAQDMQIHIALATTLMESTRREELKEAFDLLEGAVRSKPAIAPMVRLYQGEILMKLGEKERAIGVWKTHLDQMPAGDERRRLFEQKISEAKGA